jgi:hypothetical protein
MKRTRPEKLRLSRETMRTIADPALAAANGAVRRNPEVIDSQEGAAQCASENSACESVCGPCGLVITPPPPLGYVFKP